MIRYGLIVGSLQEKMKNGNTPVYIIPKDAPEIDTYTGTFKYLDENKCQGLNIFSDFSKFGIKVFYG